MLLCNQSCQMMTDDNQCFSADSYWSRFDRWSQHDGSLCDSTRKWFVGCWGIRTSRIFQDTSTNLLSRKWRKQEKSNNSCQYYALGQVQTTHRSRVCRLTESSSLASMHLRLMSCRFWWFFSRTTSWCLWLLHRSGSTDASARLRARFSFWTNPWSIIEEQIVREGKQHCKGMFLNVQIYALTSVMSEKNFFNKMFWYFMVFLF